MKPNFPWWNVTEGLVCLFGCFPALQAFGRASPRDFHLMNSTKPPPTASKPVWSHGRVDPRLLEVALQYPEEHRPALLSLWCAAYSVLAKDPSKADELQTIHHELWRTVIPEGQYRWYLDQLIAHGFLECNHSYWAPTEEEPNGFSKSYRIPNMARITVVKVTFREMRKAPKTTKEARFVADDEKAKLMAEFLDQIEIRSDFDWTALKTEDPAAYRFFRRIHSKKTRVSRPHPNGRIFHDLLSLGSKYRKHLRWNDGQPLVEWDVAACFWQLLVDYCPPSERLSYETFVKTSPDLYGEVDKSWMRPDGTVDEEWRRESKKNFMRFLNGGRKNVYFHFFQSKWPELTAFIMSKNKAMARLLQNVEASIIVDALAPRIKQSNLVCLSMHDGGCVKFNQLKRVKALFREACIEVLGRPLKVKGDNTKTQEVGKEGAYQGDEAPVVTFWRVGEERMDPIIGESPPDWVNYSLLTPLERRNHWLARKRRAQRRLDYAAFDLRTSCPEPEDTLDGPEETVKTTRRVAGMSAWAAWAG